MRKTILLIFMIGLYNFYGFSQNIRIGVFLQSLDTPFGISIKDQSSKEIAYFAYRSENNYEIIWESSGYLIALTDLLENEYDLVIGFIKIWIGAEETVSGKRRHLAKYLVNISKKQVNEKVGFLVRDVVGITPDLIIEDSYNSIKEFRYFHTKAQTEIRERNNKKAATKKKIESSELFDILDVVPDEDNEEKLWVKIKHDRIEGFIPLESLSDNWTVIKNDLKSVINRTIYATINDRRVRLRSESNLSCDTWGLLNKGDKVQIKDKTAEPFEIGGEHWYWYKVETEGYPDGWVYGKYLDIDE